MQTLSDMRGVGDKYGVKYATSIMYGTLHIFCYVYVQVYGYTLVVICGCSSFRFCVFGFLVRANDVLLLMQLGKEVVIALIKLTLKHYGGNDLNHWLQDLLPFLKQLKDSKLFFTDFPEINP